MAKILLVEDNELNRDMLSRRLARKGYDVVLAEDGDRPVTEVELARGTEDEKQSQLARLADFHSRHREEAPEALERLKAAASSGDNVFAALMDAVRCCSLGQISDAFFEVGGQYRRNV